MSKPSTFSRPSRDTCVLLVPVPSILHWILFCFASQHYPSECTLLLDIQFYYVHFSFLIISDGGWIQWEMRLWPVKWFIVSTAIEFKAHITINSAYDTKTGKWWNPNIQFTSQYGYNSMVANNLRKRVLYAWDNRRLFDHLSHHVWGTLG